MSNSQSKRPRRSFATGPAHVTSTQHVADGLRYDGEDVPVLIRLPDLSPQALLRESAATTVPQVAPIIENTPPAEENVEAASESTPIDETTSDAPATSEPVQPVATIPVAIPTTTDQPDDTASNETEPNAADDPLSGDADAEVALTDDTPADSSSSASTPVTAEGSPSKRRRRKRDRQPGQQSDQVRSASRTESRRDARRSSASKAADVRPSQNILAFDKSRLLIGAGLVVVAGLTYFALSGGGEDPVDPAGPWAGSAPSPVTQFAGPTSESEIDLWPGDESVASHEGSTVPSQTAAHSEATHEPVPVWPSDTTGQQSAVSYDAAAPPADYTYHAPGVSPSSNGQNYLGSSPTTPGDDATSSGWPPEPATEEQPTSTAQPVQAWPDAAMAVPTTNAPSGAPTGGYHQSQAAGYTMSPSPVGSDHDAPEVRTGRLETGRPYPGGSNSRATNSGSQLNGTIDIPRARAENEYSGSDVY